MGQEGAGPLQLGGNRLARGRFDFRIRQRAAERAPHRLDDPRRGGLVDRDAELVVTDPQIDFFSEGTANDLTLLVAGGHRHGVEERLAVRRKAELAQARRQCRRAAMRGAGDVRQSLRAVIDRIHRGDHGEQHLRGADVGGRLFAADVLLAGLKRHPIGAIALGIHGHADEPAGRLPHVPLERREKRGVRTAVSQRHAEALRVAEDDVGAHLAWRGQQSQAQ